MGKTLYRTKLGKLLLGDSKKLIKSELLKKYSNQVQLILTSPPFPLNAKKEYGNLVGKAYRQWLTEFAPLFSRLLKKNGSIVIEIGNAWEPKRPIQSLLPIESLMRFVNHPRANLRLCQEFICYNPARLPSPAQWVTVNRIRVIDSHTRLWWMANSDNPKADNSRILRPYSKSMERLLKKGTYNAGRRPSEHVIGNKTFLSNNRGSIMHNVIPLEIFEGENILRLPKNVLRLANTSSNDYFMSECRRRGELPHPARMPLSLATLFIEFLTDPGDIVLDPFAGTNTTGYCAERLNRKWISIEIDPKYAKQSIMRFQAPVLKK